MNSAEELIERVVGGEAPKDVLLESVSLLEGAGQKAARSDMRRGAGYALASAMELSIAKNMDKKYSDEYRSFVQTALSKASDQKKSQAVDAAMRALLDSPVKALHKIKRSAVEKFIGA